MIRRGDVLFIRTNGIRNLIGWAAVAKTDLDAASASYLIRFRLNRKFVNPQWVTRLSRLCGGEGPGMLDFQDFFGCGWSGGCGEKSGGDDLAAEAQTSGSAPCR